MALQHHENLETTRESRDYDDWSDHPNAPSKVSVPQVSTRAPLRRRRTRGQDRSRGRQKS